MSVMDAIAVVGMDCRFPGADGVEEFWANLCAGVESISDLSVEELSGLGVVPGAGYVPRAGVVRGVEEFDAEFFGFSPREAELLDPQHRVFLECAAGALQRAGHDPARFPGPVGVFSGAGFPAYLVNNVLTRPDVLADVPMMQVLVAADKDYVATRTAYKLNLRGPAVTVQTACSTSLVAVHLAVQSLLAGECDMALAGGSSVYPVGHGYAFTEGGILSPDGHCRPFDADAAGTVPGSGVGVVVLRRLADALADGDTIHAVVLGSAMNNDGSQKVGYTAPSVAGQAAVIREALSVADVDPRTVGYVEAHGAATPLGDPIEVAALTEAFGSRGGREPWCVLGSVKSNLGHLDAAAGVAGFIKAVLTVERGVVPPTLHFRRPNPAIDFDTGPFRVAAEATTFSGSGPRRAGVSSFGMGGTNVHVVLQQPPAVEPAQPVERAQVLTVSARSQAALEQASRELGAFLAGPGADLPLADVAFSLQAGRPELPFRMAVVADDTAHAAQLLSTGGDPRRIVSGQSGDVEPAIVFVISGVGDNYPGLGGDLYRSDPTFRSEVDHCSQLLEPHLGLNIADLIREPGHGRDAAVAGPGFADLVRARERHDDLERPLVSQPLMFVLNYALARSLERAGVRPQALVGYSVGELVAACLAGVLPLGQALLLVARRAALIDRLPGGAMLAVLGDETTVRAHLDTDCSVAALDGPMLTVAAGPADSITRLAERLTRAGIASRRVPASHAFHTAMMAPVQAELADLIAGFDLSAPRLPVLSNVTGTWLTDEQATSPDHFASHVCAPVRFGDNIAEIWSLDAPLIVEIGPGQSLGSLVMQHPARAQAKGGLVLASLPGRTDPTAETTSVQTLLGRLWAAGVKISWPQTHAGERPRRLPLPTYPFQRRRYWLDPGRSGPALAAAGRRPNPDDWFFLPSWTRTAPPTPTELEDQPVLVLGEGRLAEQICAAVVAAGGRPVPVVPGERFRADGDRYEINVDRPDDLHSLVDALTSSVGFPSRVVDCRATGRSVDTAPPDLSGFYGLLHLARALMANQVVTPIQIVLVTSGGQAVAGEPELRPEHAMLPAAGRVLAQELSNLTVRSVDLAYADDGPDGPDRAAPRVVAEFGADPRHLTVAYRHGDRWVQDFQPIRLLADTGAALTRPGGTYLLVGGLGPVGLAVARHLARTPGIKLAFVQRTAVPPAATWDRLLAEENTDPGVAERIRALRELEAAGATTMTVQADLADAERFTEAVATVEEAFGPLSGLVHSAGVVSAGAYLGLADTDRASCEYHFASKVRGMAVLAEVAAERDLDFVLINSSISAVLGGIGYLPYAAANSYVDMFAVRQDRTGRTRWISLDWEGWTYDGDEDWQGGTTLDDFLIDAQDAAEVMARVLTSDVPATLVNSTGDLNRRVELWVRGLSGTDEEPGAPTPVRHERPFLQTEYVAPRTDDERRLVEIWRDLLGIEEIGVFDSFFALGGHSLIATRVTARVADEFGVQMPLHDLLTQPTVAEIAERLGQLRKQADEKKPGGVPITAVPREQYRVGR